MRVRLIAARSVLLFYFAVSISISAHAQAPASVDTWDRYANDLSLMLDDVGHAHLRIAKRLTHGLSTDELDVLVGAAMSVERAEHAGDVLLKQLYIGLEVRHEPDRARIAER